MATDEAEYAAADADVGEGQQADMLFWFDEAVFEDSTLLLGDEGKDHHHLYAATATARCLQAESNFPVEESARISPRNQKFRVDVEAEPTQHVQEEAKGIAVDVPTTTVLETEQRSAPAPAVVSPENVSIEGNQSPRYTLSLLLVILIFISFHLDLTHCMASSSSGFREQAGGKQQNRRRRSSRCRRRPCRARRGGTAAGEEELF